MTTYVLQEDLEDTTGLFIDQTRDTLDTTTTSETTDGGLGDTLKMKGENASVDEKSRRDAYRVGTCIHARKRRRSRDFLTHPECYRAESYGDALHHPFQDPNQPNRLWVNMNRFRV